MDENDIRDVMRFWGTGVVILSSSHDGVRHGMTVSSFTSLSLKPPLMLVSLERSTRTHQLVADSGVFGVTILTEQQQEISNRFAGRETEGDDRFAGLDIFSLETGSPLVAGGLAFVDCKVTATVPAGTHSVFIAEAVAARTTEGAETALPLMYYNRAYRRILE